MRFGQILAARRREGWVYIDYERLKQAIRDSSIDAAAFWHLLEREIERVSSFFDAKHIALTKSADSNVKLQSAPGLLGNLRDLHRYAVLNYLAVLKIVKKHDKNAAKPVRQKALKALLVAPFARCLDSPKMFTDLEAALDRLDAAPTAGSISAEVCQKAASPPPADCPICLRPCGAPVALVCGHEFCWSCLWRGDSESHIASLCPLCRHEQPLNPVEVEINHVLGGKPTKYYPKVVQGKGGDRKSDCARATDGHYSTSCEQNGSCKSITSSGDCVSPEDGEAPPRPLTNGLLAALVAAVSFAAVAVSGGVDVAPPSGKGALPVFPRLSPSYAAMRMRADMVVEGAHARGNDSVLVAFGSCSVADQPQWVWPHVLARQPAAWVWLGDIVYGDLLPTNHAGGAGFALLSSGRWSKGNPRHLGQQYAIQAAHPGYSALVASGTPIFGIWDDHDFGEDNADKTYAHKDASRNLLLDFLGEPHNSSRRDVARAGVYSTHTVAGGRVRVVLLDVRSNREPYSSGDAGDFLGEKQWRWLKATLEASTADVNIIVSSIQVLPPRKSVAGITILESWSRFPPARARLLEVIADSGCRRPLLLSGDVHYAEISEVRIETRLGRKINLVEITSSGLTHAVQTEPWPFGPVVGSFLKWVGNPYRVPEGVYFGMNFGELVIDFASAAEISVRARVYDSDGKPRLEHVIGG